VRFSELTDPLKALGKGEHPLSRGEEAAAPPPHAPESQMLKDLRGASAKRSTNLRLLTWLRAFACGAILVYHCRFDMLQSTLQSMPSVAKTLADLGYCGVPFFFVLSGFILIYVYSDTVWNRRGIRRFYVSRFARIAPAYYLSLILAFPVFLSAWPRTATHSIISALLCTPVFMQSWLPTDPLLWNGPGWSLSVEVGFYLLFPFLAALILRFRLSAVFLVAAGCLTLSLVQNLFLERLDPSLLGSALRSPKGPWAEFARYSVATNLPAFGLGICGGLLFTKLRQNISLWLTCGFLVSGLGLAGLGVWRADEMPFLAMHSYYISLCSILIIIGAATLPQPSAKWRSLLILDGAGEMSYCIYLIHLPLLAYWQKARKVSSRSEFLGGGVIEFVAFAAVVIGISFIIWRQIENRARPAIIKRLA
jgi:peptidoglycan/LPS O-acetylase OafA/YrhL